MSKIKINQERTVRIGEKVINLACSGNVTYWETFALLLGAMISCLKANTSLEPIPVVQELDRVCNKCFLELFSEESTDAKS